MRNKRHSLNYLKQKGKFYCETIFFNIRLSIIAHSLLNPFQCFNRFLWIEGSQSYPKSGSVLSMQGSIWYSFFLSRIKPSMSNSLGERTYLAFDKMINKVGHHFWLMWLPLTVNFHYRQSANRRFRKAIKIIYYFIFVNFKRTITGQVPFCSTSDRRITSAWSP